MLRNIFITILLSNFLYINAFKQDDLKLYQKRVRSMFNHAFDSYMNYAHPADELMPLSCKGRYRGSEKSRGDIDDSLGNFSLTLIDTLDTLFILKEYEKFEHSVKEVMKVSFDTDVEVSMFETNIRVLGGLLGGHISASLVKKDHSTTHLKWYSDQLLDKAVNLADKLLPGFETETGIPYSKINLKLGITKKMTSESFTCTACAGTFIMEFGALSRLTGNPIYEEKARKALFGIFNHRNRHSDLVGTVINIQNGNWYSADSGVGASIDSYYEYLFKAYVLFGEETFLEKFQIHYAAIKKYMQDTDNLAWPYLFLNVELHRPLQRSRTFIDALLAFWPGITVMFGDVMDAVAMHEMFNQIIKRHIFLPEAFTPDLKVYWGHHLLRPEFIESTYLLYEATNDPYYLEIAANIVDKLENYSRVDCGYAAIKDVRTLEKYDQMDSFFLAETLKYLYLIFTPAKELPLDLMNYVFTTEAHILPINLRKEASEERSFESSTFSCPNIQSFARNQLLNNLNLSSLDLFRNNDNEDEKFLNLINSIRLNETEELEKNLWNYLSLVRLPIKEFANRVHPLKSSYNGSPEIDLLDFGALLNGANSQTANEKVFTILADFIQLKNPENLKILKRLGIIIKTTNDNKIEVTHNPNLAESTNFANQGYEIVQSLIKVNEINESQRKSVVNRRHITILNPPYYISPIIYGGPSQFGVWPQELSSGGGSKRKSRDNFLIGNLVIAVPFDACSQVDEVGYKSPEPFHFEMIKLKDESRTPNDEKMNNMPIKNSIAIVRRGNCMFVDKARFLQTSGAIGMIVLENANPGSIETLPPFSMSVDDPANDDLIKIPALFLYNYEAEILLNQMKTIFNQTNLPATGHMGDGDNFEMLATISFSAMVNLTKSWINLDKVKDKDYMNLRITVSQASPQKPHQHRKNYFVENRLVGINYSHSLSRNGFRIHLQLARDEISIDNLFLAQNRLISHVEKFVALKTSQEVCQNIIVKFFELARLKYVSKSYLNERSVHLPKDWLSYITDCLKDQLEDAADQRGGGNAPEIIIDYSFYETDYGEEDFGIFLDKIIKVASLKS